MKIQTRVENPQPYQKMVSDPRTAPRVITKISDLSWAVFVQRRRRAKMRRRTLEELLFPTQ